MPHIVLTLAAMVLGFLVYIIQFTHSLNHHMQHSTTFYYSYNMSISVIMYNAGSI